MYIRLSKRIHFLLFIYLFIYFFWGGRGGGSLLVVFKKMFYERLSNGMPLFSDSLFCFDEMNNL